MRVSTASLLLLAFVPLGGCLPSTPAAYRVEGAADYVSTPRSSESSGALPLTILYCSSVRDAVHGIRRSFAQVGQECLVDEQFARHTVCALPTGPAPTTVQIEHAVMGPTVRASLRGLPVVGPPFNFMAAGRTQLGGYMSYRFTGATMAPASIEHCEQLARLLPPPPPQPPKNERIPEPVWASWNRGPLCTVEGCAEATR